MPLANAFLFLVAAQLQIGIPMAELGEPGDVTVSMLVVNKSPASVDTTGVEAFLVDASGKRTAAAPVRYWISPGMRRSVSFSFQGADPSERNFSIEILGLPGGPTQARVFLHEDEDDWPVALIDPAAARPDRSESPARRRGDTGPLAELLVHLALGLLSR